MLTWTTLVFIAGAEWAPDSSHGLDRLQLEAAGTFQYENHVRGERKTASGTVAPEALAEIGRLLAEAEFPDVPPHDIPPGASLVEITVETAGGSRTARMDYFAATKFPGYRELLARFERWTNRLRDSDADATALPGLVRTH